MTDGPPPRRCRRRPLDPRAPRPSDLLAAFFIAGIGFLVAGAAAGVATVVTDIPWMHWLTLHLIFLGGVSQLILGAGQFFTCAFLATSPPSRRLVGTQLAVWNTAVVLVAVGKPAGVTALVAVGGVLVALGLLLFAAALRTMQRRSLQQARWGVRWYQACGACLGAGALLGIAMARGTAWPYGSLLGAHLSLNVAGWMGTAIVGTLHTFFPSLSQTRLRFGHLQAPTFVLWLLGVCLLAIGTAFDAEVAVVSGWLALAVAATLLSTNLLASLRSAPVALALPARLLALGQVFLAAGIIVALVMTITHGAAMAFVGPARSAPAVLLLAGWIGLTVAGALLHLLAVLARVRRFTLTIPGPRPSRDRLLVVGAGVGVAALALAHVSGLGAFALPGKLLTAVVTGAIAVEIGGLLVRALAPRRRRPPAEAGRA